MNSAFTWETAVSASRIGKLEDWIHEFLRGPGINIPFSDGLRLEERKWYGPLHLPRALLRRTCGPEPEMPYPEDAPDFERRINALSALLKNGWNMPPLIVNFNQGRFDVNDGNHRLEALFRRQDTEIPVIVWTTGPENEFDFKTRMTDTDREGVVGCLVVRPDGRIFAQKRSPDRKSFPGCWDLVGGHIESGETARHALVRELEEETGWELDEILGLRKIVDWETAGPEPILKREFVVAVTIRGNWDSPRLEQGKVTEGRWFRPQDVELLNENRGSDTYVYDLFREEFRL